MDLNAKLQLMTIEDAEYIMRNQNNFRRQVIDRAEEVLSNSPYIEYRCKFCGINWIQRKGYREFEKQLCYRCFIRGL
ncbi:hypothetical protein C3733_19985 [Bacillus amyloliquefaciens]|nr:hypothetical protein C3733_19985 [Bacillus amyloliquefaciens]